MEDKTYNEPRLGLNKIYTRQGDNGETRLAGGQLVQKDSTRLECYGAVDELNAAVGMALASIREIETDVVELETLGKSLLRVQHELFNAGSVLATLPEDVHPKQARITGADVERLEREIDAANEKLPALRSFVLPGGTRLNAELHLCRTVCRRAERLAVHLSREESVPADVIRYLNRLSDAFFVWSRWANVTLKLNEILWDPNQAASAE